MRPVHHEPQGEIPDLELRGACIACGGDLSVRLRPGASRCVCRRCGGWAWVVVEYADDGVQLAQGTSNDA
jgi:hypothetical protein